MNKKSVGRPIEQNPRNIQVKFNVTKEEDLLIKDLATKLNMNKSKFIRDIILLHALKYKDKK